MSRKPHARVSVSGKVALRERLLARIDENIVGTAELRAELGVSRISLWRVLRQLEAENLIEVGGTHREPYAWKAA